MTSEVKDNQEFARWIGKWRTRIQQCRAPTEHLLPDKTASAEEQKRPPGTDARSVANKKRIHASLRPLSTLLLVVLVLQGCNALNPLCDSARPAPILNSLSATTITFAQVQQGFLLTLNGSEFVGSSVVVINRTTLSTQVLSSKQLSVTITTMLISAPGSASITVSTPSGNSGNLGCTSGGTSKALTLTIT